MALRSKPYYWLVCDLCGRISTEDSDYAAWNDVDVAETDAEDSEWHCENGNHLCWDCIPHPPDWDDDHELLYQGLTDVIECPYCLLPRVNH